MTNRVEYLKKMVLLLINFTKLDDSEKQKILVEEGHAAYLAAQYMTQTEKHSYIITE